MSKRILLSAFACDPLFGSDEEVGWQWARQLAARGFDVTVVTRASHRHTIESHIARTGECASVKFIYVDLPRLHRVLKRINRRNHLYYYLWQWQAYRAAAAAHRHQPFDLVHHVTWVSFRQPSFMWKLGIPFYFGPVAGGDEIPDGYTGVFSAKQRIVEVVRRMANRAVRWDPLMRTTFARAARVYFTSEAHLRRVPRQTLARAWVELAIGCDLAANGAGVETVPARRTGGRLLFVGRCIGLKGMDLGMQAFAHALARNPALTLTIVGDGEDRPRWQEATERLGVSHAVRWQGWLPKDEVLRRYAEFDLLFYPSLRDSGGFVVLEALQRGLPVVCFRLGGPGVVVDESCGQAVCAAAEPREAAKALADAVVRVLDRASRDPALTTACRKRADRFTWSALIDRVYSDPDSIKAET